MQFSLLRLFVGMTVLAIVAALAGSRITSGTVAMASAVAAVGCLSIAKRLALHESEPQRTNTFSGLTAIPFFFIGVGAGIFCLYWLASAIAVMMRG